MCLIAWCVWQVNSWEEWHRDHGGKARQSDPWPPTWEKRLVEIQQVSPSCTGNLFLRWTDVFGPDASFTHFLQFLNEKCPR